MLFDDAFFDDPYPSYRRLAEAGPIHRAEFLGGAWLLTRHRDIRALLLDDRLSANRAGALVDQFPEEQQAELAEFRELFSLWMLFHDPPRHGAMRRILLPLFSPESLLRLRAEMAGIIDHLLDGLSCGGGDWMEAVAYPLPVRVISTMLGVPDSDVPVFLRWSDDIAEFFGSPAATIEIARRAQVALCALTRYFGERIRTVPAGMDGSAIAFLARQVSPDVTAGELAAQCAMLLFAGHETTRNLIGNGLAAMLRHPDQLDRLRRQPELAKTAPDEFLRYDSPVQVGTRIARVDLEIHSRQVRAGELLLFLLGAANRDPAEFDRPEHLDISRKPNSHVSFGHGPHLCLGLGLARLEAELLFAALVSRFPAIHLSDEKLRWNRNFGFRGLRELAIRVSTADLDRAPVGAAAL
jgi:cytochrome P450